MSRKLRRIAGRRRLLIAVGAAATLAVVALSGGGDEEPPSQAEAVASGDPVEVVGALLATLRATATAPFALRAERPVPGPRFELARVREGQRVPLLDAPGGRRVATLGETTEFGGARTLWVRHRQGDWLGVPTPELPNDTVGWIRDDPDRIELTETQFWIDASRSRRVLALRHGDRLLDRHLITVGGPGTETPLGAYAVTDALAGPSLGPYYGCCVLALSGHQPNLPPGWIGGDRIAIHGTPDELGLAASAGCLRASDETMVALLARVPIGAPVFVRE